MSFDPIPRSVSDALLPLALGWALLGAWACAALPGEPADDDGGAGPDDDTADEGPDWGYEPDPDVDTYVPDGYRAQSPKRLIVLGDSISAGVGATGSGNDYVSLLVRNDAEDWPDFEEWDLESLFPELDEVIDVSEGGALTLDVVEEQIPALEEQLDFPVEGETLVVMTAGGNDAQLALVVPDNLDAIIDNVEENLRAIHAWFADPERFPDGVWLYAANVYEPTDGVGQYDGCFFGLDFSTLLPGLDEANGRMRQVAEELGFSLVDLHGHFLGHGFYAEDPSNPHHEPEDPTTWFALDCIHPNNRGHHEVRRLFYVALDARPLPAPEEE